MKKRNVLYIMTVIGLMNIFGMCANAIPNITNPEINPDVLASPQSLSGQELDVIKKVSFRDKLKKSPEAEIGAFYKKYNKYTSSNNSEKLKELYSDDFLNNDGFNKEIIFKMMEDASSSYKNIKYNTDVHNVVITGNTAIVKVHELATGETTKEIDKLKDNGLIKSEIYYIDYLRKFGKDWKITNTVMLSETVELKYGEAKNITFDMQAPECVSADSDYEVTVDIESNMADAVFLVGSIVNEPIVYPQKQNKDVFRAIKSDSIARILKSNNNGNNEYATLSVAVTRAQVEPTSVVVNMTGMAFAMKRINVLSVNANIKK